MQISKCLMPYSTTADYHDLKDLEEFLKKSYDMFESVRKRWPVGSIADDIADALTMVETEQNRAYTELQNEVESQPFEIRNREDFPNA